MKPPIYSIGLIFLLILLLFGVSAAKIYQYQDTDGNWHFTDTPSEDSAARVKTFRQGTSRPAGRQNLKDLLYKHYRPSNAIKAAAIATVTIKSSIGLGSGFFVSSNGHILTNRHVLRGDEKRFQATERAIGDMDRRIETLERHFQDKKQRLDSFREHLDAYKKNIEEMADSPAKKREMRRYTIERERYEACKAGFQTEKAAYESRRNDYEDRKMAYRFKTTTAALSRNFTVILKNGDELNAYLLDISQAHDLALLKIDGCRTPHVSFADPDQGCHGEQVYAIGSPAGLHDSVSKGIFSGFESKKEWKCRNGRRNPKGSSPCQRRPGFHNGPGDSTGSRL